MNHFVCLTSAECDGTHATTHAAGSIARQVAESEGVVRVAVGMSPGVNG